MYTKSHIPAILNTYWPRGAQSVDSLPYLAAASVLPMRTNNYVVTQLIDWSAVPDDPMFQLTFPQPGKLREFSISDFVSNKTVSLSHRRVKRCQATLIVASLTCP